MSVSVVSGCECAMAARGPFAAATLSRALFSAAPKSML